MMDWRPLLFGNSIFYFHQCGFFIILRARKTFLAFESNPSSITSSLHCGSKFFLEVKSETQTRKRKFCHEKGSKLFKYWKKLKKKIKLHSRKISQPSNSYSWKECWHCCRATEIPSIFYHHDLMDTVAKKKLLMKIYEPELDVEKRKKWLWFHLAGKEASLAYGVRKTLDFGHMSDITKMLLISTTQCLTLRTLAHKNDPTVLSHLFFD